VSLLCPTCGGTEFEHTEAGQLATCTRCGLKISKDDLIRANSENIEANMQDITNAVTRDAAKALQMVLKQAFRGNKNIKIK